MRHAGARATDTPGAANPDDERQGWEAQREQLARRRWLEVQQAARSEVRSGHRAAGPLEQHGLTCWQRARFLALRAELADAWQARDQMEQHLIDQMTQFQTLMERWQETLNAYLLLAAHH
jgi:hypothetical protein